MGPRGGNREGRSDPRDGQGSMPRASQAARLFESRKAASLRSVEIEIFSRRTIHKHRRRRTPPARFSGAACSCLLPDGEDIEEAYGASLAAFPAANGVTQKKEMTHIPDAEVRRTHIIRSAFMAIERHGALLLLCMTGTLGFGGRLHDEADDSLRRNADKLLTASVTCRRGERERWRMNHASVGRKPEEGRQEADRGRPNFSATIASAAASACSSVM
jgi:hypothetical protein